MHTTTDVRHLLKSMNQDAVWLVTLVLQYLEGTDSEEDLLIGVNNAVEKIQRGVFDIDLTAHPLGDTPIDNFATGTIGQLLVDITAKK